MEDFGFQDKLQLEDWFVTHLQVLKNWLEKQIITSKSLHEHNFLLIIKSLT